MGAALGCRFGLLDRLGRHQPHIAGDFRDPFPVDGKVQKRSAGEHNACPGVDQIPGVPAKEESASGYIFIAREEKEIQATDRDQDETDRHQDVNPQIPAPPGVHTATLAA